VYVWESERERERERVNRDDKLQQTQQHILQHPLQHTATPDARGREGPWACCTQSS